MQFIPASTWIGLLFTPLAAGMAFLITYAEYTHHYPDKRRVVRLAAEAAVATFVFFAVLSFVAGYFIQDIAGSPGG
jgi:acyl-CoA reductase-like NAD-dependent aldehyde dehydrogenase